MLLCACAYAIVCAREYAIVRARVSIVCVHARLLCARVYMLLLNVEGV